MKEQMARHFKQRQRHVLRPWARKELGPFWEMNENQVDETYSVRWEAGTTDPGEAEHLTNDFIKH